MFLHAPPPPTMRYFQQSELNHTYIVIRLTAVKGEGRRERDELGAWDW